MLVASQIIPIFVGVLYRFDVLSYLPHLIGLQTLFHFLVGPLAYFYVRACTQKKFEFRLILWLHLLPFLLDIFYNIPFFMLSASEKIASYEEFVLNGTLYSPPIFNLVKSIHGLIYFGLSLHLIQQYRKHLPNAASSIDKGFHRWLLFFIFIVCLSCFRAVLSFPWLTRLWAC